MKGYKALNADMTAKHGSIVYEIGKSYTHDGEVELCKSGFHFCPDPGDCFHYYGSGSRIFEVEAGGTIVEGDGKCACSEITLVREADAAAIARATNSGKGNSGIYNSGGCNSGNRNSGGCNSGDWNSGWHNSGDWNSGNRNSGDWNIADFSSGVLCTEEPECLIFDKPSGMTLAKWRESDAARLMGRIDIPIPCWRSWDDMSPQEREANVDQEPCGGVLVVPEGAGRPDFAGWWAGLSEEERDIIKAIPNFDAGKWKLITGIEV